MPSSWTGDKVVFFRSESMQELRLQKLTNCDIRQVQGMLSSIKVDYGLCEFMGIRRADSMYIPWYIYIYIYLGILARRVVC